MRSRLEFAFLTRQMSLLVQVFKSLQAETAHIDLAFAVDDSLRQRFADRR